MLKIVSLVPPGLTFALILTVGSGNDISQENLVWKEVQQTPVEELDLLPLPRTVASESNVTGNATNSTESAEEPIEYGSPECPLLPNLTLASWNSSYWPQSHRGTFSPKGYDQPYFQGNYYGRFNNELWRLDPLEGPVEQINTESGRYVDKPENIQILNDTYMFFMSDRGFRTDDPMFVFDGNTTEFVGEYSGAFHPTTAYYTQYKNLVLVGGRGSNIYAWNPRSRQEPDAWTWAFSVAEYWLDQDDEGKDRIMIIGNNKGYLFYSMDPQDPDKDPVPFTNISFLPNEHIGSPQQITWFDGDIYFMVSEGLGPWVGRLYRVRGDFSQMEHISFFSHISDKRTYVWKDDLYVAGRAPVGNQTIHGIWKIPPRPNATSAYPDPISVVSLNPPESWPYYKVLTQFLTPTDHSLYFVAPTKYSAYTSASPWGSRYESGLFRLQEGDNGETQAFLIAQDVGGVQGPLVIGQSHYFLMRRLMMRVTEKCIGFMVELGFLSSFKWLGKTLWILREDDPNVYILDHEDT